MLTWFCAGADYYNINMIVQIHDPGNADGSAVTARIVGVTNPIAVPAQYVNDLRAAVGYNPGLVIRPQPSQPFIPPQPPPVP